MRVCAIVDVHDCRLVAPAVFPNPICSPATPVSIGHIGILSTIAVPVLTVAQALMVNSVFVPVVVVIFAMNEFNALVGIVNHIFPKLFVPWKYPPIYTLPIGSLNTEVAKSPLVSAPHFIARI